MSGRRGRSQARRTGGTRVPGWAWLVAGLLLGAGALWLGTSMSAGDNDFLRPRPNPDAQPTPAASEEAIVDEGIAGADGGTRFDFYTLLPGDGEAMTDAELAASARAEAEAAPDPADGGASGDAADFAGHPDAAELADPAEAPADAAGAPGPATAADQEARYVLQAGAFADRGDAESVKARIAMLGLTARVEAATVEGGTVHRVRMGPYASAAELAEAKRKLADGGLPSLAIRAR